MTLKQVTTTALMVLCLAACSSEASDNAATAPPADTDPATVGMPAVDTPPAAVDTPPVVTDAPAAVTDAPPAGADTPPAVDAAPDFKLPDTNGNEHSLSQYRGKWVVLEWINHGCPFVKKHYRGGHMQALQKKYTDKDVVWLSICSSAPGKQGHMDAEEWNEAIADKGAAATAVLMDPEGGVGRLYGAKTTPHMFVIDPAGVAVYEGAIDSVKDARSSPDDADNYVSQVLDAVLAGNPSPVAETKPYGCSVKYAPGN